MISGLGFLDMQPAGSAAGTRTFTINDTPVINDLTITAPISDGNALDTTLSKAGAGRLTLNPTMGSEYLGTTAVTLGVVNVANSTALGDYNVGVVGNVVITSGATRCCRATSRPRPSFRGTCYNWLAGSVLEGSVAMGALRSMGTGANNAWSNDTVGAINLTAASDISVAVDTSTTVDNVQVTGASSGTFKLSFGGSTTGAINFNASLASIQTVVRALPGLSGAFVSGSMDNFFISYSSSVAGTLAAAGTSGTTATATIDAGTLTINGGISGAVATSTLAKFLPGTLVFAGNTANNDLGATTVSEGTLVLNKAANTDAIGPGSSLVIGNDAGGERADGQNADQVIFANNNQIDPSSILTIQSTGLLNLAGFQQTFATTTLSTNSLTMEDGVATRRCSALNGGTISLTSGANTGNINITNSAGTFSINSPSAVITGSVSGATTMGACFQLDDSYHHCHRRADDRRNYRQRPNRANRYAGQGRQRHAGVAAEHPFSDRHRDRQRRHDCHQYDRHSGE